MQLTALKIHYTGAGGSLNLDAAGCAYSELDLMRYDWSVDSTTLLNGLGAEVNRFYWQPRDYKVKLSLWDLMDGTLYQRLDSMIDLFERDIYLLNPGRLYVNDEYINCYVTGISFDNWDRDNDSKLTLSILAPQPLWIHEVPFSFRPGTGEVTTGKKYAYHYRYRYTYDGLGNVLVNQHYKPSYAKIVIYGYAKDPIINVADKQYQILDTIEMGERVEIDQLKKTVTKIYKNGTRENIFAKRGKKQSVFSPLPEGENLMVTSGMFGIDITLYQDRSVPRWTAS